jgi:hypothetical protein
MAITRKPFKKLGQRRLGNSVVTAGLKFTPKVIEKIDLLRGLG